MSADDRETDTGAYALGALPDDERDQFERHVQQCPRCAEEVRELLETASRIGAAAEVTPPPELRARVLAHVARVRQLPPWVTEGNSAPASPAEARSGTGAGFEAGLGAGRAGQAGAGPAGDPGARAGRHQAVQSAPSRLLTLALAASVAAVFGLGGVAVTQQRRLDQAQARAERVEGLLGDPARQIRTAPVSGRGSAAAVAAGGNALVLLTDVPPPPPGRGYQLWVMNAAGVRPAGVLQVVDGAAVQLVPDLGPAQRLALTVEALPGAAQPTTDPVWSVNL